MTLSVHLGSSNQKVSSKPSQNEGGDHPAFGVAPGAEAGLAGNESGNISCELSVEEAGGVSAVNPDWGEEVN